ncbi:DNA alkylation repair protein [Pseudarthrobacter sp. NBSH8]|uniref:DNA alkylation repair protein n=1 Tax=Pseudarthrobacter sp. NBSH8 TaxID=2596911 RepID=UPI00351B2A49
MKATAAAHPFTSAGELRATVLELWRGSTVREERYAAIDLTGLRLVARDQLMLPVYEEIIRTGKWWDFVDGVSDRIGGLLQAHRPMMTELLLAWSTDQDFWIRRSAITSQLWVCNFVMIKGTQLSPLSRQEAMRHLEEGTTPGVTGSG